MERKFCGLLCWIGHWALVLERTFGFSIGLDFTAGLMTGLSFFFLPYWTFFLYVVAVGLRSQFSYLIIYLLNFFFLTISEFSFP